MATYENLGKKGYLVVKNVLSQEDCRRLSSSLIKAVSELVFTRQGFDVDPTDPETLELFMDQKLRELKLGESGKTAVWRDGNTRQPLISKNCGMSHIHFNEDLLKTITYSEELYNTMSRIAGTPHLVHCAGPERFCLKPKGATDMPAHIDSNLFHKDVNYEFRIQSLVTLKMDTEISPRDSGTLCVIPYFHLYWDFAREIFHPQRGICKFPDIKGRFFLLPTKKDQNFDKSYLPKLKEYASEYSLFLKGSRGSDHDDFYSTLEEKNIQIPHDKYLEKMVWTPIQMKPGDMVFWHQYLPHRSLRQKSAIPRICAYYSVFPVDESWYGTPHQKWIKKQFEECKFFYGVDADKYPEKIVNVEEYEMMTKKDIQRISKLSTITKIARRVTGQEDYFEKNDNNEKKEMTQLVFQDKYWSYAPELIPNPKEVFERLLPQIEAKAKTYTIKMYGKEFESRKVSCLFAPNAEEVGERANAKSKEFNYSETPAYEWSDTPQEVLDIKNLLEEFYGYRTDYVLCHIYRGITKKEKKGKTVTEVGQDYIGWHNDKEATTSEIFSVSLGAPRKFQFRKIEKKDVEDEIRLKNGDVVHMFGSREGDATVESCQTLYKHQVPQMTIPDLVQHIEDCGLSPPPGRKTYTNLASFIEENDIAPDRINLTFRQFED